MPVAEREGPAAPAAALSGRPVLVSWSGGKDGALALHEAVAAGARPAALLTMLTEGGERTRSHGLRVDAVAAQAAALGLPLVTRAATWAGYEEAFADALRELRAQGIADGVFGDIDIEDHRAWVRRVCGSAGVEAHHPLWQRPRRAVVGGLAEAGIDARVVAVREGVLPRGLLGRRVDAAFAEEVEACGADAAGEQGEYHSVVVGCPLFAAPLRPVWGGSVLRDGVWFADLRLATIER